MKCAWEEFLNLLPSWMRQEVDRRGKEKLQELRVRRGHPPEMVMVSESCLLQRDAAGEDLEYVVNAASRYSPWAAATMAQGYLTGPGGHRIGICGEAVIQRGAVTGIRRVDSLCIRVARDISGIARGLPLEGSVLIIGSPGAGKTTLLRDLVRQRSDRGTGSIAVVDERGELFPAGFNPGKRTDVLTGCPKGAGIDMVLRTMGPVSIAVDEITADADCDALIRAGWCGTSLLATAHASSREDLLRRPVYRKLVEYGLFDELVILQRDKSWRTERMKV